jgi:hypothetical protein
MCWRRWCLRTPRLYFSLPPDADDPGVSRRHSCAIIAGVIMTGGPVAVRHLDLTRGVFGSLLLGACVAASSTARPCGYNLQLDLG